MRWAVHRKMQGKSSCKITIICHDTSILLEDQEYISYRADDVRANILSE